MTIVFATTLSLQGSTIQGRILPIAKQLASHHQVHLLLLNDVPSRNQINYHRVGSEPFIRTNKSKHRLSGLALLINMLSTAFNTTRTLWRISPDVVVISKALPHNVLGVKIWRLFHPRHKIILDVDDFELSSNQLSSIYQRAAIHWAERVATDLATHIIAATPFLADHYQFLSNNKSSVTLIPTGVHSYKAVRSTPSTPIIAYIGSLSISSGHRVDLLPDILQRLKTQYPLIKLMVIGSGEDTTSLKQSFVDKGLTESVIWHGRFSPADLPALLSQISILIDPIDSSIANRAKSSFRVSLAAASGLPVVTSNIGIRPLLLPPALHSRFFAQPNNTQDYANKISALINHPLTPSERTSLIKHSQANSWSRIADQYYSIIQS